MLKKGDPIIHFEYPDINGNLINTENYAGKKLMISFYRYAECMFCNLRIHQLLQKAPMFEANGLQMIAFFQSPKEDVIISMEKHKVTFPIIADSDRSIYKKYGVMEHSKSGFIKSGFQIKKMAQAFSNGYFIKVGKGSKTLIPADFLIDTNQNIHHAFYGNDISDHMPITDIEKFLTSV